MSRVSDKPYFVYVLWSASAFRFYIGISENPQQRLSQHNVGQSFWTSRYRPWTLIHIERFSDYRGARMREIQLKRQKSGQNFFRLTGLDPKDFKRASH
ncbi:MAG: GIY-YIG nuclease family protein [Acidobacteria bacterium]|nr:GIY-YIG nuclease family protein [Acidobacteriota bacterium]